MTSEEQTFMTRARGILDAGVSRGCLSLCS